MGDELFVIIINWLKQIFNLFPIVIVFNELNKLTRIPVEFKAFLQDIIAIRFPENIKFIDDYQSLNKDIPICHFLFSI